MVDDRGPIVILRKQVFFAFSCALILFILIVPIDAIPNRFPYPDFLLALTTALIVRRALVTPFWLIGIIFLMADIILSRPLGLWAFIVLISLEIVRNNRFAFREMSFFTEWATVTAVYLCMFLTQQALLGITFSQTYPLNGLLWEFAFTALVYPLAVFFVAGVMRIQKPLPGQSDALGQRT